MQTRNSGAENGLWRKRWKVENNCNSWGKVYTGRFHNFIHGHSRVVTQVLLNAAKSKTFNVIITESRGVVGDGDGYVTAGILTKHSIPCTVILDSAVGYTMEKVDMCLVGASGVVENGGIVNKVGTYQLAVVANAFRKPLYVAAESYKFARLYPLNQDDLPSSKKQHAIVPCVELGKSLQSENSELLQMTSPTSDYTPFIYYIIVHRFRCSNDSCGFR